jgi:exodeoxyribonuclease III
LLRVGSRPTCPLDFKARHVGALSRSDAMRLKVTTWNINSVRLRIDLVAKFIKAERPDVLCLQETKCPDEKFPLKRLKRLGYEHVALNGQKGYHGVSILSRLPFEAHSFESFCGKVDCRHITATLGERAGLRDPITLHNFYVPAGGDLPDPELNPKFAHKLAFLDEMRACAKVRCENGARAILVGDLNVAPREHDVWSHKQMLRVVSHTPVEVEKLTAACTAGNWVDIMRVLTPEPEKLYTWWSYRAADWQAANRGRRLDHIWVSPQLADRVAGIAIEKSARGWARPSDHVPVTATLEV